MNEKKTIEIYLLFSNNRCMHDNWFNLLDYPTQHQQLQAQHPRNPPGTPKKAADCKKKYPKLLVGGYTGKEPLRTVLWKHSNKLGELGADEFANIISLERVTKEEFEYRFREYVEYYSIYYSCINDPYFGPQENPRLKHESLKVGKLESQRRYREKNREKLREAAKKYYIPRPIQRVVPSDELLGGDNNNLLVDDAGIKDSHLGDQRLVEEQYHEHEHERGLQLLDPGVVEPGYPV